MSCVPFKRFSLNALVRGHAGVYEILVDESDAYLLRAHAWGISCDERGNKYVARHERIAGSDRMVMLQREIMEAEDGEIVIHRNDNTFDCRRANLRVLRGSDVIAYRNASRFGQHEIVRKMKAAP